jgi:Serine/Threonine/Tyrosine Kinase found in polyvalent proteins
VQDFKYFKNELQHIIKGKGNSSQSNSIQSAKAYLTNSAKTGNKVKGAKLSRAEEERALKEYTIANKLFVQDDVLGNYITEGAEQKIFYPAHTDVVLKKADAIFYLSWAEYFDNLLIHNAFFPDTCYTLIGFTFTEEKLFAIVQQPFVFSSEKTDLTIVKNYLLANGFLHKKNNDYYHPYLGIIAEDLHDENVLTNNGVLFFVDTVFYLMDGFYEKAI